MAVVTGTVYEGSAFTLLARVTDKNNAALTSAVVSTITYEVWDITGNLPRKIVSETSLTPSAVFFAIRTGGPWTVDSTGYNFLYEVPATDLSGRSKNTYPNARQYSVEFKVTPTTGSPIFLVFQVNALPTLYGTS